jgi:hypothetical protein
VGVANPYYRQHRTRPCKERKDGAPRVPERETDGAKATFIKTNCAGKISSVLLSSLRNEIGASLKYRLTDTLDDDGQMDTVFTIYMTCSERESVTGIASVFGQAKCFSKTECHLVADGSSLRSDLCDSTAATECGRSLFKVFEDYTSNPRAPKLKVNRGAGGPGV